MPFILARVHVDGQDRAYKKVVLALRLAKLFRPWATITGSDVYQIGLRIVGKAIPSRAASTELPPFATPGFGRLLQRRAFEWFRRITGDCPEGPCVPTGVGVECREES